MNEDFEENIPEFDTFLGVLKEYMKNQPKVRSWIAHPINYPRIMRSVNTILEIIRKVNPDIDYSITFDPLTGTDLALIIKCWGFSFDESESLVRAASLCDSIDIDALTSEQVEICFGFRKARIPVKLERDKN